MKHATVYSTEDRSSDSWRRCSVANRAKLDEGIESYSVAERDLMLILTSNLVLHPGPASAAAGLKLVRK